jgi:hypothetical protein
MDGKPQAAQMARRKMEESAKQAATAVSIAATQVLSVMDSQVCTALALACLLPAGVLRDARTRTRLALAF